MATASGLILLLILMGNHGITYAADAFSVMNDCLTYGEMIAGGDWWGLAKKILNTGKPPEDGIPEVMNKLGEIEKKMDEMASMLSGKMTEVMQTVIKRVPKQVELDSMIRQLSAYIVRIETLWRTFKGYQVEGKNFRKDTMQDFIKACVSNIGDSVRNTISYMVALISPEMTSAFQKSFYQVYLSNIADHTYEEKCGKQVTEQYEMFVIHRIIVVMMMRSLNMIVMAYTMQSIYNNQPYKDETEQAVAQYVLYMERLLTSAKVAFSAAPREIINCDSPEHKYDVTYTTFKRLFFPILIIEDDAEMNDGCKLTCSETYFDWRKGKSSQFPPYFHGKMTCPGYVNDCHWLGRAEVCESPSAKTYEWITSDYGVWGKEGSCPSGSKTWVSRDRWFWSCDPCYCTCTSEYADSEAERAISLWPVTSDIEKNKVIISLEWHKSAGIVRAKPGIAELGPGGRVINGTEESQYAQNFKYNAKASERGGYDRMVDGKAVPMKRNEDFMFIDHNHKTINLDDVECEGKYIMTGFKMGCADKNCESVQSEVRCTPFDWNTGKLKPNEGDTKSIWITPQTMKIKSPLYEQKRKKIQINDADEPGRCKSNLPISNVNQAVDFDRTNLYKDTGKNVIPGWDLVPTVSANSPLGGVGVYYKGGEACGGLITFKLIALNYAKHINPALTKKQLQHYEQIAG